MSWYRKNQRPLPWRGSKVPNPYHIVVSEAMLQQTQVSTVLPYYERFIKAFPTLDCLAAAPEQQVLRLWQGLGYYRRARNLHAAAQEMVRLHGGKVPEEFQDLMKLPGVGRYTAGAIASIGFDQQTPVLDGNVSRVLARWFAIGRSIDETSTRKRLWKLAEELVPQRQPGQFNQALMELGALVCTARQPRCSNCPVVELCQAHQANRVKSIPVRSERRQPRSVTHTIVAVERAGRFLFEQRPSQGLWARMWQLPTLEDSRFRPDTATLWAQQRFGLKIENYRSVGRFTHRTTHRQIQFVLWWTTVNGGRMRSGRGLWRSLGKVQDLPLANPQRRAIKMLLEKSLSHKGLDLENQEA